MKFIVAKNEHVDRMCEITGQAKRQLKGLGLDQWQKGYPSREVWLDDVKKDVLIWLLKKGRFSAFLPSRQHRTFPIMKLMENG